MYFECCRASIFFWFVFVSVVVQFFIKKILHLPVFKQDWVDAVKGTVDLLPALGTGQDHLAGNEYEQHNFERRDHPPD